MRWTQLSLLLVLAACGVGSWVDIRGDRIVSSGGRVVVLSYQDPPLYLLSADLLEEQEDPLRRVRFRSSDGLERLWEVWREQLQKAGWREVCQEFLGVPLFGGPYLRLRYNKELQDISLLAQPEGPYAYRVELRRPPARQGPISGCPLD